MAVLKTRAGRWLVALALLWATCLDAAAQSAAAREFQVKAVFLYNFVRFVDWPPRAFPDPQSPMVIGVLGEDPFGASLDDAVRGETVNGRPLIVQRYRRIEDLSLCHVLFIGQSETARIGSILARLRGRNILTVSDAEEFARLGGMIRFVNENKKVRLQINLEAARAAELTISSKLLRPADTGAAGRN